jgi:hypothetical protein
MTPTSSTSNQTLPISWISRVHTSWYDQNTQSAVEGYVLTYTWLPTGSVLVTKIPDASYTADAVSRAILAAGNQDNTIHGLAQQSG